MLKKSEVDVVYKVGFIKVSRVYSVQSGKYDVFYFHPNLVKMVSDMDVISLHVLLGRSRIMGIAVLLIYVLHTLTNSVAGNSHCGIELLLIPSSMVCTGPG